MSPAEPFTLIRLLSSAVAGGRRVVQRARPDHSTIYAGAVRFSPLAMVRHFLYIKVAPSRSASREPDDLAVDRARAFVDRAFPGSFPLMPEQAGSDQVCFAVTDQQSGTHVRAIYLHRSGLVEVLWGLSLQPAGEDRKLLLPAVELVQPVLSLANAVASDEYTQLSKAGRGRRRFAKVDWVFSTTAYASGQDGQVGWDEIGFPADAPPRATGHHPFTPLGGYGQEALRSTRRVRPPEEIAAVFLRELLLHNGYHSLGDTVEQVVTAAERAAVQQATGPDSG